MYQGYYSLQDGFNTKLSCDVIMYIYNYKSIRSKSNFYRYIFLRFFMSGLLVTLYSSIDKAAVREKKLHYTLKDSILLLNITGICYKHSVCFTFLLLENATINSVHAFT